MIQSSITLNSNITHQMGLSLIEVLVALSLTSLMILLVMPFQLRLLRQARSIEYTSLACTMQRSLAEHIKACSANATCIQQTIQQWKSNVQDQFPTAQTNVTQHQGYYRSTLTFHHDPKPLIFEFSA